jgi:protocatechuate 3,4-dioxygenase beta subunit
MTNHEHDLNEASRLTRRESLIRFAGAAALVGGAGAWRLASADAAGSGTEAVSRGLVQCVLTPELTEGPYYVSGERLRRDITEGKAGTPLLLNLRVINARTCKVIKNATVEIWHCDAEGAYSGSVANNPGTNFLRGGQKTNANGIAQIKTIYPGFYNGRAVHIHVKVHVRGNVVHTGQLFFPAAITDAVYAKAPYSSHGTTPDTTNADDSIYRNGGRKGLLAVKKSGAGYFGTISMGVQV